MTATIYTRCGTAFLVDAEDVAMLEKYVWRLSPLRSGKQYVVRAAKEDGRVSISVHRQIMGYPIGLQVDHKNGDPLDNRRANLRVCTAAENGRNKKPRQSRQFKGVYPYKGRFRAIVTLNGKHHLMGIFDDPISAAVAYDEGARRLHGEFAHLNFKPNRDWILPYSVVPQKRRGSCMRLSAAQ